MTLSSVPTRLPCAPMRSPTPVNPRTEDRPLPVRWEQPEKAVSLRLEMCHRAQAPGHEVDRRRQRWLPVAEQLHPAYGVGEGGEHHPRVAVRAGGETGQHADADAGGHHRLD